MHVWEYRRLSTALMMRSIRFDLSGSKWKAGPMPTTHPQSRHWLLTTREHGGKPMEDHPINFRALGIAFLLSAAFIVWAGWYVARSVVRP